MLKSLCHKALLSLGLMGLLALVIGACNKPSQSITRLESEEYLFDSVSIRALEAVDSVVWFAGNCGVVAYTRNGGSTWTIDTLKHRGKPLHFRGIVADNRGVAMVTSIVEPAAILRTVNWGQQWDTVFIDRREKAFLDAIAREDSLVVALGDPDSLGLQVLISTDYGAHWHRSQTVPGPHVNEAPYAASNSNISIHNGVIQIATGGASGSRLYTSKDGGRSWVLKEIPLTKGGQMTGAYGVNHFGDDYIVVGGDWNEPESKDSTFYGNDAILDWFPSTKHLSAIRYSPDGSRVAMLAGRIRDDSCTVYEVDRVAETLREFHLSQVVCLSYARNGDLWAAGFGKVIRL